jgi:HEAT repeat protein
MGKAGSGKEEDILLSWLKGDAPTPALREAAIRALGDIGSKKAAETLGKILEDGSASRFERVYSAEALAKIAWAPSLDSLVKAANGDDGTVQAAAVEAIGSFDGAAAETALLEALRDSYAKSRVAACKALGKKRLETAVPNLEYKASSDPDKGVKSEALRALAAIGSRASFEFMATLMQDRRGDASIRVLAFGLLARKDVHARQGALLAILQEESKTVDRGLYTSLVREIAQASDAPDAVELARFLLSDRDYLIRLGGIEWARVTKSTALNADIQALAEKDPAEAVRKRASEVLAQRP